MGRTGYVKQPGTWHAPSAAFPAAAADITAVASTEAHLYKI